MSARILTDSRDRAIFADGRSEAECPLIKAKNAKALQMGKHAVCFPLWNRIAKHGTQYVIYSSWGKLADVLGLL